MAKLLDHQEIDGIQEYDNPIPNWLLALFASTVVFGIGYAIYYPSLPNYNGLSGWSSTGQYEHQMTVEEARYAPLKAEAEQKALVALASLASDQATVTKGSEIFAARCAPCHGEKAEGRVGPSLADDVWVYGGEAKDILQSIREGRPKGMPKWKSDLDQDEIQSVTAFVMSLTAAKEQAK
jgi:cytochrome c oxidase cbb3-type subunit 3